MYNSQEVPYNGVYYVEEKNFDNMLNSKQETINPSLARGSQKDLEVNHLTQNYFDLPIRTKGNANRIKTFFKRTLTNIEKFSELPLLLVSVMMKYLSSYRSMEK